MAKWFAGVLGRSLAKRSGRCFSRTSDKRFGKCSGKGLATLLAGYLGRGFAKCFAEELGRCLSRHPAGLSVLTRGRVRLTPRPAGDEESAT